MAFVERDASKAIKGAYAIKQPGIAEEEVADDHAELLAFRASIKPQEPDPVRLASFKSDTTRADLLTKLKSSTPAQIKTLVKNATAAEKDGLLASVLMLLATDNRT